jgi:hypothetical protein
MEVVLSEFRVDDLSAASCRFATAPLPSQPLLATLVVAFAGIADNAPEHRGTFRFLRAMAMAGLEACEPRPLGLVLDLSQLDYAWGDAMAEVLTVGARWAGAGFPTAIVASQRNEFKQRIICRKSCKPLPTLSSSLKSTPRPSSSISGCT